MGNKFLQARAVSAVDMAQSWSRAMVMAETRGPGDMENAMRRLEARYGVPWRTFWALRYRPPKSICADIWLGLQGAHAAELKRQMRKLQHDIEITKAIAGPGDSVVAEAQALVAADEGKA